MKILPNGTHIGMSDTIWPLMADASEELLRKGYQARRENRLADAKQAFIGAVELCRAQSGVSLARALTGIGQIERDEENRGLARQYYEEALAIYRLGGEPLRVAHTVRHLGDIHQEDGRLDLAELYHREALDLYRADQRTPPLEL